MSSLEPTLLQLTIDTEGHVVDAKILKSSGAPSLDETAVRCVVQKFRYKPKLKDGLPVKAMTEVQIDWRRR
jgi:TonB family protein